MPRFLLALPLALTLATPALACPGGPEGARCIGSVEVSSADFSEITADGDYSDAWREHLAQRRAVQIERLTAYANARVFPVNDDAFGMQNIFLDEEGRPCAMANLIWQDGHEDLVRRTSKRDNDLLLGDVKRGPLMDWMLTSGLTQDEAAFVQEPDFYVGGLLPVEDQQLLLLAEQDRLQAHFLAAAQQLKAYEASSLDAAVQALGNRVKTQPPEDLRVAGVAAIEM